MVDEDPMVKAAIEAACALRDWKDAGADGMEVVNAIQKMIYATIDRYDELRKGAKPRD